MKSDKHYHLYVDASLKGYGALVYEVEHKKIGPLDWAKRTPVLTVRGEWEEEMTCNTAEYEALLIGVMACIDNGYLDVSIFSDSELVVKQLTGRYMVKSESILEYYITTKSALKQLAYVKIRHIPGKHNPADALSRGKELL
jgi:ribonuclease HI